MSNTCELIKNKHWNRVLIEVNSKKFRDLKRTFGKKNNAILINEFVAFEGNHTFDNIIVKENIPVNFDLLSIDIDGNDYHVWESLKKHQPRVVVIEFNPTIPGDIEFVQEKKESLNHGKSLLSLIKLGKTKGYELITTTTCNGIFVRKDLFDLFEITDNSINSIWENYDAPRIFQLYDGTLALTDEFKLLWHNKPVNKFDLQAVPKSLRCFGDSSSTGFFKKVLRKIYYIMNPAKNNSH